MTIFVKKYIKLTFINNYLPYLSVFLSFIPVILYFIYKDKLKSGRLIVIYLISGVVVDLFISPLFLLLFQSPFLGAHLFTLIEFSIISIFLFYNTSTTNKKIVFFIGTFFFICTFSYENFIITQKSFDSISTGISTLIILIYSIYFLYNKANSPNGLINFDLSFLVIVSFVIYFSGTFFIYILSKNNLIDIKFQQSYIIINSLILALRNIIISFSFIQKVKETKLILKEN